jgi:Copine
MIIFILSALLHARSKLSLPRFQYNSNREIPVYGFGAKLGSNKIEEDDFSRIEVSHCFPLNSDWASPHYSSIDEVIKAYRNLVHPLPEQFTLPESEIQDILGGDGKKDYVKRFAIPVREQIQFSYPTMFTPLLEEIEARVRTSMTLVDQQNNHLQSEEWGGTSDLNDVYDSTTRRSSTTTIPRRPSLLASTDPSTGKRHVYHILVILTDGQAADFELAAQKVKEMSKELPLCVVIIGVGAANFQLMKTIESASDIVKFVEFRKYAALNPDKSKQRGRSASTSAAFGHVDLGDVISTGSAESGVLLARDVLADIPAQFLRYVRQQSTSRRGSQGTFSWTGHPTADEGFERIWASDNRLDERLPTYAEAIEQQQ